MEFLEVYSHVLQAQNELALIRDEQKHLDEELIPLREQLLATSSCVETQGGMLPSSSLRNNAPSSETEVGGLLRAVVFISQLSLCAGCRHHKSALGGVAQC